MSRQAVPSARIWGWEEAVVAKEKKRERCLGLDVREKMLGKRC
jgi:hypothetical protein